MIQFVGRGLSLISLRYRSPIIIAAILLTAMLIKDAQSQSPRRRVLILHSYHHDYPWTNNITEGIKQVLEADASISIFIEYMDTRKHASGLNYFDELAQIYRLKYQPISFDVIIACDDDALDFLLMYRDQVFPGSPVVFCGVSKYEKSRLEPYPQYTGIVERMDIQKTLDVALTLHPETRQVAVIYDQSSASLINRDMVMQLEEAYASRVKLEYYSDLSLDELRHALKNLKDQTVILYMMFLKDRLGNTISVEESLRLIRESSEAPIYSCWYFTLEHGVLGGMMVSGHSQGRSAALLAQRILQGESAGSIPVVEDSPNVYVFNHEEMKRLGVNLSALPFGSVLVNQPVPFYSRYRWLLLGGALFIILQSGLILILLLNRMARIRAVRELKNSERRLHCLFEGIDDAILVHDRQGNILDCNESASMRLGYSRDELLRMNTREIDAPAFAQDFEKRLQQQFSERRCSFEGIHITRRGRHVPVHISTAVIEYHGKPAILSVVRDITLLKEAEESLQNHLHFLSTLLDTIPNPIYFKDTQGVYQGCNRAFAEFILGCSRDQAIGKSLYDFPARIPRSKADENHLNDQKLIQKGGLQIYEDEVLCADGIERFFIINKVLSRNTAGEITGIVGVMVDITERRRTEEELQSRYRFEQVISATSSRFVGLTKFDQALQDSLKDIGMLTGASRTYLFLFNPDEKTMNNTHEWCAEGVKPEIERLKNLPLSLFPWWMEKLQKGEIIQVGDIASLPPEAHAEKEILESQSIKSVLVLPVFSNLTLVGFIGLDHNDAPKEWNPDDVQLLRIFSEILSSYTERKQAEENLRKSEWRLASAASLAHVGHWDWDIPSGEIFWSDETYRIHGMEPGEFHPNLESFIGGIHEKDRDKVRAEMERAVQQGSTCRMEFRFYRKDGEERVGHSISDVHYEEGTPVRMSGTMQDITELRRAEQERRNLETQIQQAQKLESLGVLAGGIAHDFNNLLVSVIGNADLALLEMSPVSPARECIEQIQKAAHHAAELTRQMLAYSGKGKFVVQPVQLTELVEEMVHLLQVSISKKATLNLSLQSSLPLIEADVTQMRQIVMNLITNASEALGENSGIIRLSTGIQYCKREYFHQTYLGEELPEGNYVFLEVSDTGCGMDAETVQKIFEPFFSTKFTGRGLGLAAVLGIVRGHQGALLVSSLPGQGTTFKVLFPASSHAIVPSSPDSEETRIEKGLETILVVDDEETVRALVSRTLTKAGYSVLLAADGIEALEVFQKQEEMIHLVLLDLTMPRLSGEETFAEIKRLHPAVPIMLSSGYNEQDISARFSGKDLAGFIQKPYRIHHLLQKIQTVLQTTRTS